MNGFKNSIYKLGRNIAEIRKKRGYTQKSFGEILDVNEKTISKWERGITAPDVTLLTSIADVLNVTVDELLRGEKLDNEEKVIENDNVFNVEEEKDPEVNEDSDPSDVGLEKRYLGGEGISICVVDLYTGNARRRILASISIIIAIIILSFSIFSITKNHYEWKKIDIYGKYDLFEVSGYIFKSNDEFKIIIDDIGYFDKLSNFGIESNSKYVKLTLFSDKKIVYSNEIKLEASIPVYRYFTNYSIIYESDDFSELGSIHLKIEYILDGNELRCFDIAFSEKE